MATFKKYYIGDRGPFYYDADRAIEDPDGDFVGENEKPITSDGSSSMAQMTLTEAPVDPTDVVRLQELTDQINGLSLTVTTATIDVVTDVDFVGETTTKQTVTYVTDVILNTL